MTRVQRANGSSLPLNWDARKSLAAAQLRQDQKIIPLDERPRRGPVNLADMDGTDLISSGDWPVRDQAHRGTCNAFAVVAAEELANWRSGAPMQFYSEEYLYAAARRQPLTGLNADEEKVCETGSTFLRQVKDALRPTETGLVKAGNPAYDGSPERDINFAVQSVPLADAVVTPHENYAHDVFETADVGAEAVWASNTTQSTTLVDIFLQQLNVGIPVVASFAILGGVGARAFTNAAAREYGLVTYPAARILTEDNLTAADGHTVCLTGFVPDPVGQGDGWFVFRNSYGTDQFAHNAAVSSSTLVAPAAGYGLISSWDVEIYCWEYLFRI